MIRTLLVVGLLAAGASEASARSLVGKWDCDARDGRHLAIKMLLDYRQSGQFYHLANVAIGDRRGRLDGSVALSGNWFRNHAKLKETITRSRMRSLKANGQDISDTPIGRQMARSLPSQMAGPNPTSVTHVQFVNDRHIKLSSGRLTATCTKR